MTAAPGVLAITGGHRIDEAAFDALLDTTCAGWARWERATQPDAQALLTPDHVGTWAAVLLHDVAGLDLRRGEEPDAVPPSQDTRAALAELLYAGQGVVVLHHALASWPAWDGWARAIGGRYLYAPGTLDGRSWPASGYRMTVHEIEVLAPEHPVCAGLGDFTVDDELYLCPVFDDDVVPLLATRGDRVGRRYRDTYAEVRHGDTTVTCAAHPPVGRLVGWAKVAGRSPLVYLQPGHGASTFTHPAFQRLLANALRWVASPDAHAWARAHPAPFA